MTQWGLRTKLLLSVGITILIVIGFNTMIYIQDLKRNYLEAIQWRSDALAQNLVGKVIEIHQYINQYQDLNFEYSLSALSVDCQQLYELNQAKDVAHIALLDPAGTIIAHNDKALRQTQVESQMLLSQLERRTLITILDGMAYHTLIPIFDAENLYLGAIDVGFPKTTVAQKVYQVILHSTGVFGIVLILALITISALLHLLITAPLERVMTIIHEIEQEHFDVAVHITMHGEMRKLAEAFNRMGARLKESFQRRAKLLQELKEKNAQLQREIVERKRREDQITKTLQETQGLFKVAQAILEANDPQEICQHLLRHYGELVQADRVMLVLVDQVQHQPLFSLEYGNMPTYPELGYAELESGIIGNVLRSGQPILSLSADDGIESEAAKARWQQLGIGALMVVPLVTKHNVIGTVTVINRVEQRLFTQHDVDVLMSLATQAAAALENTRLLQEEHRQRQMAESLREVSTVLNSSLDQATVLAKIFEQLQRVVPYDKAAVFLREGKDLVLSDGADVNEQFLGTRLPLSGNSLEVQIFTTRTPVIIEDVRSDPRWEIWEEHSPIRSWMCVPLFVGETTIGLLTTDSAEVGDYTEEDAQVLQIFANQAAIAIENARLFEQAQQELIERKRAEKVQTLLYRISEAAHTAQKLEALFPIIHEIVGELMPAQNLYIALYDAITGMLNFPYFVDEYEKTATPKKFGKGLISSIIHTGTPLLLSIEEFIDLDKQGKVIRHGALPISWLGVPLNTHEKTIGVLTVQSYTEGVEFGETEQQLLGFVSTQIAAAIERVRAEEELRRYRTHLEELVEKRTVELTNTNAQLQKEIIERERAQEALQRLNEELEERVQERTTQLQEANRALQQSMETLQMAQDQLVQAEKMAALGTLVAGVAHEINTPVGIGVTAASFLENRTQELRHRYESGNMYRSELEQYLATASESARMILQNLRRAAEQIQSFKQVAVDQVSSEERQFNVKTYIDDLLLSLHPKLKRTQHTVTVHCPEDLEIKSYPGTISQILTNLILNSLIHGFDDVAQGELLIEIVAEGGVLRLCYHDNGKGMPKEVCARIFEPFYTTKRGQGSTGLGMHIVYNLITQQLGGTIQCESDPGVGTTFIIQIPVIKNTDMHDSSKHLY